MVNRFPDLCSMISAFDGVLLDAYGVFWCSNAVGPYPGAGEVMRALVESGKVVGVLSNATRLSDQEITKLKRHGLIQGVHFHFFITSGEATRRLALRGSFPFATPHKKFYLSCGIPHPASPHEAIFQGTGYEQTSDLAAADFIYLGIPHINGEDQCDPELFRSEALRLAASGKPMLCANPDRFAMEGKPPRPVVRSGSIAAMCEEAGATVHYVGKPDVHIYKNAMEALSERGVTDPRRVLMVGDTPETDIRGARRFGMPSALVCSTGMMQGRSLDTVSDLPDYFIERF